MKLYTTTLLIFLLAFFTNCNPKDESTLVQKIEKSHKKDDFLSKKAIKMDINVSFSGKTRFQGEMTLKTNSSEGLIKLVDGNIIYFNKDKVYCSPELESNSKVRFDAYT